MIRDLRDPAALGRKYLHLRQGGMAIEDAVHVPAEDFKHSDSVVRETVEEYRKQMTGRAAQGDAAAGVVCDEHAWAYVVPPDDSGHVSAPVNVSHARHQANGQDIESLEVKQCRKVCPHDPHMWSEVPQPGVRASVKVYGCHGLGIEYV